MRTPGSIRSTKRRVIAVAGTTAFVLAAAAACTSDDGPSGDVVRLWVEPDLVECEGVAPMECLQVKRTEDGEVELFYDQIDGFDFSEGTSYVIDVRVTEVEDPPADASSLQYSLVEVVSTEP